MMEEVGYKDAPHKVVFEIIFTPAFKISLLHQQGVRISLSFHQQLVPNSGLYISTYILSIYFIFIYPTVLSIFFLSIYLSIFYLIIYAYIYEYLSTSCVYPLQNIRVDNRARREHDHIHHVWHQGKPRPTHRLDHDQGMC